MVRDDRFYAFIVAHTSRSRSRIRRIAIHKRWLKLSAVCALFALGAALYGFYGLAQQARHLSIESENARLREENQRQRQQLENLNNRVEAVEDASRKLVEISGATGEGQTAIIGGTGGPALPFDEAALSVLESKTRQVEQELEVYKTILEERSVIPSLWPVRGNLESGFGGRRNPFGGASFEYHEGQDIDAPYGEPVAAAASGTVIHAGWQNGYGQVVYIDHGSGLTTRYGHLSQIEVAVGQSLARGEKLGLVGSTGRSTGPHLHYEVRINNEPVNPRRYLPGAN
ncbi:MAG: peptidoglycan DD-metalloendopeptidase family protein [Pyrinomonadaceae bacterium]|nr:peptidoglycan DD-metalloendopeptidase family protein [Pyrinomonadaceae bacterium]